MLQRAYQQGCALLCADCNVQSGVSLTCLCTFEVFLCAALWGHVGLEALASKSNLSQRKNPSHLYFPVHFKPGPSATRHSSQVEEGAKKKTRKAQKFQKAIAGGSGNIPKISWRRARGRASVSYMGFKVNPLWATIYSETVPQLCRIPLSDQA